MLSLLANHLWQSTIFAAVAGLLVLVLRKNAAQLRYWLWMTASLKFLVPFSFLISFGAQLDWQLASTPGSQAIAVPQSRWSDMAVVFAQPAGDPTNTAQAAAIAPARTMSFGEQRILFAIWLTGFIAVIAYWTIRWLRVRATLRNAQPISRALSDALDFPAPIKTVAEQTEPGIVGVFRPILLVPHGLLERLNPSQIKAILAHERCHLERRDNLTASIHMLIEAVFWFHPLVWWIGSRLVEERERACDAAVLRAGNDPEAYASGILDVCQHYVATPMPCVSGVSGAELKHRIRSIMTHKGEVRLQFAKMLLLASAAIAMIASPVLVGALLTSPVDAQTSDLNNTDAAGWPGIAKLSISVSQSDVPANRALTISPNGIFTTRNWSLRGIIAFAYNLQDGEILERSAGVTDLASTRYNIVAQSAVPLGSGVEMERQYRLMVRRLLSEQFQLQFHVESQRTPVYALILDPGRSGFRAAAAGDPGPAMRRGVNSMQGYAAPMLQLKQYLSKQLKRPLLDQTGLTERYNYRIQWGPEQTQGAGAQNSPDELREPSAEVLADVIDKQLGLSLVSQDAHVKQMVLDHLRQPTTLTPAPIEISVDPARFDRHVGYYKFSSTRTIYISRNGQQFTALLTGQPPLRIYPEGEDAYFAKSVDVKFKFTHDASRTSALAVTQGSETIHASRMDDREAKLREQTLARRVRDKIPQPGTEVFMWDYLRSLAADKLIYNRMTAPVASAVRAEWPTVKTRFEQLGALQSIKHTSVGPIGADIYLATFEQGASEWRVSLNDDGLVDLLAYRRMNVVAPQ